MTYQPPPRAAQYNRENSLPSYEEAVANVHHPPATIYEQVYSGNGQPDYQYAARSQVAEISSRIPNVDARVHVEPASRTIQIAAEERRRADRRRRRDNRVKGSICIAVLVILGFLILYYMYFGSSAAKRTRN